MFQPTGSSYNIVFIAIKYYNDIVNRKKNVFVHFVENLKTISKTETANFVTSYILLNYYLIIQSEAEFSYLHGQLHIKFYKKKRYS